MECVAYQGFIQERGGGGGGGYGISPTFVLIPSKVHVAMSSTY